MIYYLSSESPEGLQKKFDVFTNTVMTGNGQLMCKKNKNSSVFVFFRKSGRLKQTERWL